MANRTPWTLKDLPSLAGKRVIVTGTGGLGYETALAMAQAGGEILLTGRNELKGRESIRRVMQLIPHARIRFEMLDLASLTSVAACAQRLRDEGVPIDILVNNAAVMANPKRQTTADGFELQLGTNYLGHFAFTGHILPLLRQSAQPRVVQLSSLAHRQGKIFFDDLQADRKYSPWARYCQSKLAMLMFAFELQRHSDANGWNLISTAAHPGYSRTDLIANGPGANSFFSTFSRLLRPFFSQSAAAGALPTLLAASPEATPGGYYGPLGFYEMKGPPGPSFVARQATDSAAAKRLWEISEQLTGVRWTTNRSTPKPMVQV